jgi:hypothetical protein
MLECSSLKHDGSRLIVIITEALHKVQTGLDKTGPALTLGCVHFYSILSVARQCSPSKKFYQVLMYP